MGWYALYVESGKEEIVTDYLMKQHPSYKFVLPRRYLTERRGGETVATLKLLFPGYIFANIDSGLNFQKYYDLKKTPHLYRLINYDTEYLKLELKNVKKVNKEYCETLKSEAFQNSYFKEVDEKDLLFITNLLDDGHIIQPSNFRIKDGIIEVVSGPLVGKEYLIKKIDKRKHKVKIHVSLLYEEKDFYIEGNYIDN